MRLPRVRFTVRRMMAVVAIMLIAIGAALAFYPGNRVTEANFAKIRLGMSDVEVRRLLGGAPTHQEMQIGLVQGADEYTINVSADPQTLRARGFRDYRFAQWTSPEVSIMVVSETDGRVACRYSGKGQPSVNWVWVAIGWVKRWAHRAVTGVL